MKYYLPLLLLLSACVTLTPQQQADFDQCHAQADMATAGNPDIVLAEINSHQIWANCMRAKGYNL